MATYMLPSPVPPNPSTESFSFERPRVLRSSSMRASVSQCRWMLARSVARPRAGFFAAQPEIRLLRGRQLGDASRRTRNKSLEEPAMLKNVDPLLSPELLSTLRAMGHGDEL